MGFWTFDMYSVLCHFGSGPTILALHNILCVNIKQKIGTSAARRLPGNGAYFEQDNILGLPWCHGKPLLARLAREQPLVMVVNHCRRVASQVGRQPLAAKVLPLRKAINCSMA